MVDGPSEAGTGAGGSRCAELMARLGLSDDELCTILDLDPLSLIAGAGDERSEVAILLDLTAEPAQLLGLGALARWLRAAGPEGRPLDRLLARDFAGFEDGLAVLGRRGVILRRGRPGA